MDTNELQTQGYKLHHTASKRGYISRKLAQGTPKPYTGKFGTGYTVEIPRTDTTQYVYVQYWIRQTTAKATA